MKIMKNTYINYELYLLFLIYTNFRIFDFHFREGVLEGRDEACLAVLDGLYDDGLAWHDVACHHKKPTICELP